MSISYPRSVPAACSGSDRSGIVPVAVLKRIFRQRSESLIVLNAHKILRGQFLEFADARERRDFDFMARESEEECSKRSKNCCASGFLTCLGFDRRTWFSVQVLTPMHRACWVRSN